MVQPLQAGPLGPDTLPLLLVVAGLGLSIAEAMVPGAHFIVLGVALLGAGLVGLALPGLVGLAAGPFALGLLVLVFGGAALYAYRELSPFRGGPGGRTSDSTDLKGRTGRVTERVTPTEGEVRLSDGGFNPVFAARSMDGEIPAGSEVMVVDPGGGNVLTVTPVEAVSDGIDRELARTRGAGDDGRADPAAGQPADGDDAPASRREPEPEPEPERE